ncbi:hypothetical protein [Bifidobacterium oedipodis]|uniref:Uncharacterized protein n=1 Tax=Bifidobacterium oedipodis TaxID=2675322 RepID=A0A7Y0EQ46_9BIFI|nr:hypothetical protein [Bifidobacterium sp. DSM 109957]NMM94388.1 hypothetical protein [Bifidobacterium sp. DSM 109957]
MKPIKRIKTNVARTRARIERHSIGFRLLNEDLFRSSLSSVWAFGINALYSIWNLTLGVGSISAWFITMGCYYLAIASMRLRIVRIGLQRKESVDGTVPKRRVVTARSLRFIGVIIILLTIVMIGMVTLTITRGSDAPGNQIIVISQATYTFVKVGIAIKCFAQQNRKDDMLFQAICSLGLVDAAISLLFLQTTMIDTFSTADTSADFREVSTAATGAAICICCLFVGIRLVIKGIAMLRGIQQADNVGATD